MNKCFLVGRLVRDCELRFSQSGVAIATFTLAVDRQFKNAQGEKESDFIQVKAFKKLAELCGEYLSKGKQCAVIGSIQTGSYEKEGRKIYTTDVIADEVQFLSPKENSQGSPATVNGQSYGHEVSLSEDIPF